MPPRSGPDPAALGWEAARTRSRSLAASRVRRAGAGRGVGCVLSLPGCGGLSLRSLCLCVFSGASRERLCSSLARPGTSVTCLCPPGLGRHQSQASWGRQGALCASFSSSVKWGLPPVCLAEWPRKVTSQGALSALAAASESWSKGRGTAGHVPQLQRRSEQTASCSVGWGSEGQMGARTRVLPGHTARSLSWGQIPRGCGSLEDCCSGVCVVPHRDLKRQVASMLARGRLPDPSSPGPSCLQKGPGTRELSALLRP